MLNEYLTKKHKKYKLASRVVDCFGTVIEFYQKKPNAKAIDTLKLYSPGQEAIIKETTDKCIKCKEGYLVWHWILFKDQSEHVQVTCSLCKRYNQYIPREFVTHD